MWKWPLRYFKWHYTEGLYDLLMICRGLAFFWLDFWGVSYFIETLGEPLGNHTGHSLTDIFSRVSGLVLRFIFITVGAMGAILMLPISLALVVGWLLYPVMIILMISVGIKLIIYG